MNRGEQGRMIDLTGTDDDDDNDDDDVRALGEGEIPQLAMELD